MYNITVFNMKLEKLSKQEIQNHPAVLEKSYWSPSQHSKALGCLREYAFKYIHHMPSAEDESDFIYGHLLHEYLETDKQPDTSELMKHPRALEFLSYMDDHYKASKSYGERLGFSDQDLCEEPILLQPKFPSGKKPKYNFWIYGIVDRIIMSDPIKLVDFKTTAAPLSQSKLNESVQFTWYLWAMWVMTGKIYDFFVLNFVKGSIKSGTDSRVYLKKTTRTLEDFENLMEEAQTLWEKTRELKMMDKTEGGGCFRCPYRDICNNF